MSIEPKVPMPGRDVVVTAFRIREELGVWNDLEALSLAGEVEKAFRSGNPADRVLLPSVLVLLARVHSRLAEQDPANAACYVQRAEEFLDKAEGLLTTDDSERLSEILALSASLENVRNGPAAALALLAGRTDPYAIRTRTALLLKMQKFAEAMAVVEGLEPHEWWCDVAVKAYALNDQVDKAQAIVRWSASLADRSRYPQCVVRLAEGMLVCALAGHDKGGNILPQDITPEERGKLELVAQTLRPVLQTIMIAGKPSSGLDMAALQIAWQANHLLQRRDAVSELLGLMAQWTPVPVDVAQGVVSGYIIATPDLPARLRQDHPGDLAAGILAAIVQSGFLGQYKEAFVKAKELLPFADCDEKRESLFILFQQIWQNIEGKEVADCEATIRGLIDHNPRLRAIFEASVTLRNGQADQAIAVLDSQKSEDDPYWLQIRANALLKMEKLPEAVDFLLKAAKLTRDPGLLHKTGDIALQAGKHDIAAWCYEVLAELQPGDVRVRGNLAHIYTSIMPDQEKATIQFRALRKAEPGNPTHTLNLAICLAQSFKPDESLPLFDELCIQEKPSIQAILGRAQLHHSLGRPDLALASLEPFRERCWSEADFLMAYMNSAHASGKEAEAHEALKALTKLHETGTVSAETFRMLPKDEGLKLFKQKQQQAHDREQNLHAEMLNGRMPWVWAEQVSDSPTYKGWRTRTQALDWIAEEPTNRAQYCIYATNGFHRRPSEQGQWELLPLECPPEGTRVVADISALITLHRLGLLDAAAAYFGEVLVPAGYLPTVLEDSGKMVLNQRSQQQSAEQIARKVQAGQIIVLEDDATPSLPVVDEHREASSHRYRMIDVVRPLYDAGLVSAVDFERVLPVCAKPSGVDKDHSALGQCHDVTVDLSTLKTLSHFGLLDAVTGFYKVCITAQAHREVLQRLEAIAFQEETRQWHMDLWSCLRDDSRFKFVPHVVPEGMKGLNSEPKDDLPFMASFVAQETKASLLADDRVCQALVLNETSAVTCAAFGTDALVLAFLRYGKLDAPRASEVFHQLMLWRYRFIVPPPEILKALADPYRQHPPGLSLRQVAEYAHDCMRDPGLFGGAEKTSKGESMAMRFFVAWMSSVADFLILVWADDRFSDEAARRMTNWCCRELVPAIPAVMDARVKLYVSPLTARLFLSHALVKTSGQVGNPRMAAAMKAIQEALRLDNDEYQRIVTGILDDAVRKMSQP